MINPMVQKYLKEKGDLFISSAESESPLQMWRALQGVVDNLDQLTFMSFNALNAFEMTVKFELQGADNE